MPPLPQRTNNSNNSAIYNTHITHITQWMNEISDKLRLKPSQIIALLIFPILILLGHLAHLVSPDEEIYNYFTDKNNFLNQWFVKKGWLWTCLAYGYCLYVASSSSSSDSNPNQGQGQGQSPVSGPGPRYIKSLIRFSISTVWWVFFTQWFFGFPIMDRVFLLSGGSCQVEDMTANTGTETGDAVVNEFLVAISSKQCRQRGGNWIGGHDPSGHVFLLSLSSIMLIFETFENDQNAVRNFARHFKQLWHQGFSARGIISLPHLWNFMLILLWTWMFLITSIYFHSIWEKLFGLMWCYICVVFTYILV